MAYNAALDELYLVYASSPSSINVIDGTTGTNKGVLNTTGVTSAGFALDKIGVTGDGADCGIPVIGDDVYIAPGARVFGRIRVGNNVKIGPNTCVYRDVPDNAVLVLDPGYVILSYKGNRQLRSVDTRRSASTG